MQFAHNGYYKGSIPFGLIIRRLYFVALPPRPEAEGGYCSAWLAEWLRPTILRGRRQRAEPLFAPLFFHRTVDDKLARRSLWEGDI